MGSDIFLRPLAESDIGDEYLSWFRDMDVTRHLEARNITRDDALDFLKTGQRTGVRHMYAICDQASGKHIGNLKIGDINRAHGTSDLVTVIGDRAFWGRGLATEAIRQGNAIAFAEHGIRKLSGAMYATNIGSIKAYTRAGWVVEAVLHGHMLQDGRSIDRVLVSCFNPQLFSTLPSFPLDTSPYRY